MKYFKSGLFTILIALFLFQNHLLTGGEYDFNLKDDQKMKGEVELKSLRNGSILINKNFKTAYSIVEKNNKKGLADQNGAIIIPASYDDLGWSDGEPKVIANIIGYKENGLWGLINTKNSKVTEPLYREVSPFSVNLIMAARKVSRKNIISYGVINTKGRTVIPFNYQILIPHGEFIIGAYLKDDKVDYGVIDLRDNVVLPFEYSQIRPLSKTKISVTNSEGKVALFDIRGLKIIDFGLDSISDFKENKAYIYQNGKKGIVDLEGNLIVHPNYKSIVEESHGYRGIRFPEWQLLNGNNKLVQKYEFDQMVPVHKGLFSVKLGNKAALMDLGESYLTPMVRKIDSVSRGLAIFSKNHKKGLVSLEGKVLIKPEYDSIVVQESFISALKDSLQVFWTVFDTTGVPLSKSRYQKVKKEASGLLPFKRNDHWGYMSKAGHEIIPNQYEDAEPFKGLVAKARFLGSEGVINTQGDWVVNPWHEYVQIIEDDLFFFRTGVKNGLLSRINKEVYNTENLLTPINSGYIEKNAEGKLGLLNAKGKVILEVVHDYISDLQGDTVYIFQKENKYGIITKSGKVKVGLNNDFQELHPLSDNYLGVKINNRYGFVDINGALRISNQYDSIGYYTENLAPIKLRGNWGYIDKIERLIVQPAYDKAFSFSDGLAIVKKNNKYGLINREGKLVLPLEFDKLEKTAGKRYLCYQGDKVGLASEQGRLLIYSRYDEIEDLANGFVIIKRQDKYGLMTVNGVDTIPMIFESLIYDSFNDLYLGKKSAEWVSIKNK